MNPEIAYQWSLQASKLEVGEEILIPVENKKMCTDGIAVLRKSLLKLGETEPFLAGQVAVTFHYWQKQYYILLRKTEYNHSIGFKRKIEDRPTGLLKVTKVNVHDAAERRRLKLMLEEFTKEAVCDIECITMEELELQLQQGD